MGEGKKEPPSLLASDIVQEFVRVCHGNFARVKVLLGEEGRLANAAWDWGGGDWETGLGAAAHTGRREIAEYLLANGARIDIFAAAMLGQLEVVKSMVEHNPGIKHVAGPHGIPLIKHAEFGGEAARGVLEYLKMVD